MTKIGVSELFRRWYAAYPRKRSPRAAEKAFKRLKPTEEDVERWLKTLEWQKQEWAKDSPCFIPYPATYINRGMMDDEPDVTIKAVQCPRFNGLDDDIRIKERYWRKNQHLTKAEVDQWFRNIAQKT